MKAAAFLSCLLLSTIAECSVAASPPNIYGVYAGQRSEQVSKLGNRFSEFKLIRGACLKDYVNVKRRLVELVNRSGHCVSAMTWRKGPAIVNVVFEEDLPSHPGVSVVNNVGIIWLKPNSAEEISIISSSIKSFGNPTLTSGENKWSYATWCFAKVCKGIDDPSQPGPVLFIERGVGISLVNRGASKQREDSLNRELHAQGITLHA